MIRSLGPVGLFLAANLASPSAAQETDWAETARSDIAAAFALFRDNHPGWHDEDNPAFRQQLEAARDAAMLRAENATSREDYADALREFDSGLSDGHARVFAVLTRAEQVWRWSGPASSSHGAGNRRSSIRRRRAAGGLRAACSPPVTAGPSPLSRERGSSSRAGVRPRTGSGGGGCQRCSTRPRQTFRRSAAPSCSRTGRRSPAISLGVRHRPI